jgi:hypothetical protein
MEIGTRVIVRSNEGGPLIIGKVIGDASEHGLKSNAPVVRVEDTDEELICFGIVVPYHKNLFDSLQSLKDPKEQWDFMVGYQRRQRAMDRPLKTICMHCKKVLVEGPDDRVSHGICEPCMNKHYPV